MTHPLLHVDLRAGYGKRSILHDVCFDLQQGECLGLVGTSGAGKSTLTLALLGLLSLRNGWAAGQVNLEGQNVLGLKQSQARHLRGKRISLVPQSAMTALNSAVSLRAHFEEAWRAHDSLRSPNFGPRVAELIAQVRLPNDKAFLDRKPSEISVGQAQRIVIALALLHRPALLIADEPTSALDPVTQVDILSLMRSAVRQDGAALLYISHDLLSVLQLCGRIAVLHDGSIVENVAVSEIESAAQHPATKSLLRSLPVPASVIAAYARGKHLQAPEMARRDLGEKTAGGEVSWNAYENLVA